MPISAIAESIIATLAPTLTDPVGAVAGEVGAGIDRSTALPSVGAAAGAAAGEVGAGIDLARPSVGPPAGAVGAGIGLSSARPSVGAAAGGGWGWNRPASTVVVIDGRIPRDCRRNG
jgi:hypothetical protein